MNIIICTIKPWNIEKAKQFKSENESEHNIVIIDKKEELNLQTLEEHNPDYVFFPHWSYIIPSELYEKYKCIVFHMTELPFGRGGSPLQNLIVRGIKQTKISAIRVEKGIDTGAVYMKEPLELYGSATEIFQRAADTIFDKMIPKMINENLKPVKQSGEVVEFKRREPKESRLQETFSLETIYDYIRMLDAKGYPHAFLTFGNKKIIFTDAAYHGGKLTAKAEFIEEE